MESKINRQSNNSSIDSDTIIRTRRVPAVKSYQGGSDLYEEEHETYDVSVANSSVPQLTYRIGTLMSLVLVVLAGFFDLFELVLSLFSGGVGGYIKDFASIFIFPFLFWAFGVPFWKGNKRVQKLVVMVSAFIVSLIPFVSDILPELLISVVVTLLYTRIEDRIEHGLKLKKLKGNVTRFRRG